MESEKEAAALRPNASRRGSFQADVSRELPTSVYEPNRLMNCEAISKLDGADAQCVTQGLCLSHMIAVDYSMVVSQGTADEVAHIVHSC